MNQKSELLINRFTQLFGRNQPCDAQPDAGATPVLSLATQDAAKRVSVL